MIIVESGAEDGVQMEECNKVGCNQSGSDDQKKLLRWLLNCQCYLQTVDGVIEDGGQMESVIKQDGGGVYAVQMEECNELGWRWSGSDDQKKKQR